MYWIYVERWFINFIIWELISDVVVGYDLWGYCRYSGYWNILVVYVFIRGGEVFFDMFFLFI